ncbi:MAG: UvrD-helicase domain-containing protein, partial [Clostridia bacterium]|nr:UvrD-helicase domain-containing protein [Clostridia bacterium]
MEEKKWTPAQLAAIESRGRDLLVSAGAGSGKTAVLTERIIRRLTDEAEPADIARMLIVTFTKAAAGELRERISGAISAALAKNPGDKRLSRQLYALDRAKICTIHSFCLDLLREQGTNLGIRGDFRIADEAEITLLKNSLMDELIEDYYAQGVAEFPIEEFAPFADTFVGTKSDDALADIFLGIENTLSSYPEHIGFIARFAEELLRDAADGRDFGTTRCGAEILSLVRARMTEHRAFFAEMCEYFTTDEKMAKAYLPAFTAELAFMDGVAAAETFADVQRLFADFAAPRLGIIRGLADPDVDRAKALRKELGEERNKLAAKFFSLTEEQIRRNCRDTAAMLRKLHTLLSAFLARFQAEKHRRALLDFGDLERMAYDLLVHAGQPTEAAREIAARFDEIYIDEYQDVNGVQDAIFAAVSNGSNRFMVGDIKQSIYAFRGAEPQIFADYRTRFGRLDDGQDGGAAVFLSDNFRCDSTVIDFTNIVSACLFTGGRGDIPFTDDDLLRHGKSGEESGEPVRVVIVGGGEEEDDADADISETEAEWVAAEAERLIREGKKNDGTPICPRDIAILMRSAKAHSDVFEAAFAKRGIPFYNSVSGDFFENAVVLLALSLLEVIDNPTRDIYLAGALRSPVFGFTLDELIVIRRAYPDGFLYDALRRYTEAEAFAKGRAFLETLARWQRKAAGMPVDKLLWMLYTETDLPALVSGGDITRRANLMLLYEYARRFEGSSFRGLYNFLRYIADILEKKQTLETAKVTGEDSDPVRLMTIHQSKGLEFPVVFVSDTGRKFNESDLRKNIVIEKSLGIALKLSDETGFARYDTPVRQAIVKRLGDSQLEEEMRVLYVALTRARERLYVTGAVKDPEEFCGGIDETTLSPGAVLKNGGYLRWILLALANHRGDKPCTVEIVTEAPAPESAPMQNAAPEAAAPADTAEIAARFDFVYPAAHAAKLPAKLSVSKLYPTVLDESDDA